MLSEWIVKSYKMLVEIALWAFLLIGGLVGGAIGALSNHGFLGFVVGAAAAFFGMAVFLGAALVLGEIRERVSAIEGLMRDQGKAGAATAKVNADQPPEDTRAMASDPPIASGWSSGEPKPLPPPSA